MSSSVLVSAKLCDVCGEDDSKSTEARNVKTYCAECQQNLCQQCSECHRKTRATREHRLVEVGEQADKAETLLKLSESFCDKHVDKRLELYCFDCKLVVCMMCYINNHKTHECKDITEVAAEWMAKIKDDAGNVAGVVLNVYLVVGDY